MLAGMTTLAIVPRDPIRPLSGSIIPKKSIQTGAIQIDFTPALSLLFGKVENLFPPELYGFLPMEDDNV
jgi:hypothetical protein